MAKQYKSIDPLKYYEHYLENDIRPDERSLLEFRPISLNTGSISTANGSAVVKIGNTSVVCGIKAELCKPTITNEGYVIPNVDFSPLCSSLFKPGPPSDQAQVATALVANILETVQCVKTDQLVIIPDLWAWVLYCDVVCLNYDGSIIDAALIALVAALKDLKLPKVEVAGGETINVIESEQRPLEIHAAPTSCTFSIFKDDKIMCDPTHEEESLSTDVISVIINDGNLVSVHKPGGTPLLPEQLQFCISTAKDRAAKIAKLVEKSSSCKET